MTSAKSNDRKVVTPVGRLSFPSLFKAESYEGSEPKFRVTLIFDEKGQQDPAYKELQRIAKEAARDKWGDKRPPGYKSPFRNGEDKGHLDGYGPGKIFISASSKQRPGVVNGRRERIEDEEDAQAGYYARATVTAFAYEKKGNKGVAFGLHNVQIVRKGETFSGRAAAEDDFDSVDDDAWADEAPATGASTGASADEGDDW